MRPLLCFFHLWKWVFSLVHNFIGNSHRCKSKTPLQDDAGIKLVQSAYDVAYTNPLCFSLIVSNYSVSQNRQ